ncbi:MAG: DegT/DnrJ/EryC1/StrS family aminotransferase [Cyclobacteriaceae bacterium]
MTDRQRIYLSPPYQSGREAEYLQRVLQSNWLAPVGEYLDKFEDKLQSLFGYPEVIAVNSGTAALHLILKYLKIGEGDKVLVSDLTFIGGVNPIVYVGAQPVFIDSELTDWNISPQLIRNYLEDHKNDLPKALIVVHLYGLPCDIIGISAICKEYGVILIEDCAEAIGTQVGNQYVGSFGDFAFLSFNGNKTITTSGGGAIIAASAEEKKNFIYLATQAKSDQAYYHHEEIGFNYRLSNLLAALGLAQLDNLDYRLESKKRIFSNYSRLLSTSGFGFVEETSGNTPSYWLTCATVPAHIDPIHLAEVLNKQFNIEARAVWKPMHMQPVFRHTECLLVGNTKQIFQNGICLPSGVGMTEEEQDYVIESIVEIISR